LFVSLSKFKQDTNRKHHYEVDHFSGTWVAEAGCGCTFSSDSECISWQMKTGTDKRTTTQFWQTMEWTSETGKVQDK
jgi:hypothetical protein